jgi:adenylate cyclase
VAADALKHEAEGAFMSATANEALWRTIFAEGHPQLKAFQRLHSWLPSPPRCKMCFAPFRGIGGMVMRLKGKAPANRNPRYCSACDKFIRNFPGGAEVELSMLFVDVRGSVPTMARLSPTEASQFLSFFYAAATKALIETDGFVIDFRGDAVVGVYPPGFSGPQHARKALQAAEHLLNIMAPRGPDQAVIPIGIGVHTGNVYIGTLSGAEGGIQDLTILGDNVNIVARLAAFAGPGEALITDACCASAGVKIEEFDPHNVMIKGKSSPIAVHIMRSGRTKDLVRRSA